MNMPAKENALNAKLKDENAGHHIRGNQISNVSNRCLPLANKEQ